MSNPIYGGTTTTPIPFTKIDQTFNPESANAQSGTAVAEALSGIAHIAPAITINNRALQTLTVDDCSPVEHDLKVKVEALDVSTDNLLTYPYLQSDNCGSNGVKFSSNAEKESIKLTGTSDNSSTVDYDYSIRVNLPDNLIAGQTYYIGLIYLQGKAEEQPLSIEGVFEWSSGRAYFVKEIEWRNDFFLSFVCIRYKANTRYTGCEVIPVISTAPLGSSDTGDIDLSTVPITLTGTNAETKTVYANSEGVVEGLKSSYPDFTLSTDTEGIIIDCTYNADTKTYIDKKFEELKEQLVYSVSAVNTELASLTDVDE